jgi:hypothetical protein
LVILRRRRRHAELGGEIPTLLPNHLVVAGEHGAEVPHLFRRSELLGQGAGFHVRSVGSVEDRNDRGII